MRYFFHIGYNGHTYNGWQRNPKAHSVQETIEEKLSNIFKTQIDINGCGRTDTSVHASQYFFHVDIEREIDFDLFFILNRILPHSIAVFNIIPMDGKQHARFDAVQRKYDYYLHTYKNPFLGQLSSYYDVKNLNVQEMKKAVDLLPKYKDYRAFCTAPDKNEHTICNVMEAKLYCSADEQHFRFHIASNRFLGKMIRILMGNLLKIGKNEFTVEQFEHRLSSLEIPKIFEIAKPTGLYLSKVTYPYLNLEPRTEFNNFAKSDWIEI
ncbi:tRNA pseudouridine(38-40) synthase TruA [Pedobacter xixiisoli]|uniref:tRNA pseudouridine synthase A n=1 Tax=Pedobacter xixiisoli TaxID=1476464 RepID=A0A285ZYB2_9SPHI|nr:tRNA pseudouridine(38-40) synthase TruA [Pedobacter xixiisoli]SOD14635.1 tRNA pseudouridine38-40 synthase [Pedobacter xixiisoli]